MNYDVIIIGSGLAGLNAALKAAKYGKVLVLTKGKIAQSNSMLAQGGIAAVFEPGDNFTKHIQDTLTAGANHNNKKAVEYFIKNAPLAIENLEKLGVQFAKKNHNNSQRFLQNREAGHTQNRIIHVQDHTGKTIMEVLTTQIKKNPRITVWEKSFAQDLIVKNKICSGVKSLHKGKVVHIFARRVILASGGVGQLFQYTTNPKVTTGDGIALAARAGATLKDLEFIQFHPTAFAKGQSPLFLISETLRGAGAKLLNKKGERFMTKYHPAGEMAPRDIIARAMFAEGPVLLDIRHLPSKDLQKNYPTIFSYLKKNGYDLKKDLIPVTPAAHYLCGGIATDVYGKTNIKNLFAIGEVACTRLHGANRLASNSLLEAAVMSEHVMDTPLPILKKHQVTAPKKITNPTSAQIKKLHTLSQQLQKIMWNDVGIIRDKKSITQAITQIKKLQAKLSPHINKPQLELQNMLLTAKLITKAALKRKQSLGAHFREN